LIQNLSEIKVRIWELLEFPWGDTFIRGAAEIRKMLERMVVFDGNNLLIGVGYGKGTSAGKYETIPARDFYRLERKFTGEIARGRLVFYYAQKAVKVDDEITILEAPIDIGYMEYLCDILCDIITINKDGHVWRRYKNTTKKVQQVVNDYYVSKTIAGIDTVLSLLMQYAIAKEYVCGESKKTLCTMRFSPGISINGIKHEGWVEEPLEDTDIPTAIFNDIKLDLKKARKFFELICPEDDSRHNLMLASVYPFYKRFYEKFFILRARGGNGKGTYMRYWETLLGEKFQAIDFDNILAGGFERSSETAKLSGKLVAQSTEADLDEPKFKNFLKKMATGEPLSARSIQGNSFTFRNEAVLFADTNDPVHIGNTPAMKRRRVHIRFTHQELGYDTIKPYADWLTTIDGACSIFTLCSSYFIDDCQREFDWKEVDINANFLDADGNDVEAVPDKVYLDMKEKLFNMVWTAVVYEVSEIKKLYGKNMLEKVVEALFLEPIPYCGRTVYKIERPRKLIQTMVKKKFYQRHEIDILKKINNYQHRKEYREWSSFV
jgi:hypothetical protein